MVSVDRFPRSTALPVAAEICRRLKPNCTRLVVAGSLRRRKPDVGDIEILYINKAEPIPQLHQADFLTSVVHCQVRNLGEAQIQLMVAEEVITQRKNVNGHISWGPKNKYATHLASGIPVDFFSATEENWWNYLVCRTGGAENNVRVAKAAQAKGWQWNPYGAGFTDSEGNVVPVHSEQDVFSLIGLPYLEPWER